MTMTMESSGLVFKPPGGDPFPYQLPAASPAAPPPAAPPPLQLQLTHSLVMSTKQQVNGAPHTHNHAPAPAPLPSPAKPVKKLQIVESRSFENRIETSGEEEDDTEDSESRFSGDSEEDGDESSATPPEDYVELVEGYEMVSFETVVVPPPPPGGDGEDDPDEKPPHLRGLGEEEEAPCHAEPQVVVKISEDTARTCLLDHVADHVCYGREAAKAMVITDMEYVPALHYELQTFTERRETCWSYAPHRPDTADTAATPPALSPAPAPLPWQMVQPPARMFREEVRLVTVPHTQVVKTCHKCRGTGGLTCGECGGKGWVRCLHCHGDVHLPGSHDNEHDSAHDRDRCYYCQHSKHGHGHLECAKCKARGKVSCSTCEGSTNILCFIQLSISWRTATSEHISDKLNIPDDLIRDVSGQVAYEEEGWRVCPVDSFEDEVVRMASAQLVASHASKFPEEKILRQRHQVRVVPVTKVNYEWKGKARSFFVYGYENKVYVPDNSYPQSCCWGCNLM